MQWFTDIVFGNEVPSGVGDETINISALKSLGDTAAKKLAAALGV
jgi:chitosanase